MRLVIVACLAIATSARVAAADDDFAGATIIFARDHSLIRVDPRGKTETEIATFGDASDRKAKPPIVRSLKTDAAGKVLLADLDGSWQWMPLDGSARSLTPLACGDGPAQLAEDGTCVVCRAKAGGTQVLNLANGKSLAVDQLGARITGKGTDRRLVWADKDGIWSAPPGDRKKAKKLAPQAPLRSFLPSPDGARGVGVYSDEIYIDAHHKKPAEILMGFQLDGEGARRKAIKAGVPLEWSHDGEWLLVQNGGEACLMHATGGEYKCWRGYTAASISSDGTYGVFLGNRDGSHRQAPAPVKSDKKRKGKAATPKPPEKKVDPADEPDLDGGDTDDNDVAVPPPSGPLSLFRAKLAGSAFTESPPLIVKVVDGAAVWVPGTP
ncbi:hypothetical protein BH11MYX1_BH11MYX1_07180 [soil metagenome]